jgi:hypothetical protein
MGDYYAGKISRSQSEPLKATFGFLDIKSTIQHDRCAANAGSG